MIRDIIIPPISTPGDAAGLAGRLVINLALVDRDGQPVPASNVANTRIVAGLGKFIVTDSPVTLQVCTQDELAGDTFYRVDVERGREPPWVALVQVPAGDGSPLTWGEFVQLGAPVGGADLWTRWLLPRNAADGQSVAWDDAGQSWIAASTVLDAPQTGGPYGRQGGAWVSAVGPKGDQGPAGPTAVSGDAGNLAVLGTDGKLLVDSVHVTPEIIGALPVAHAGSGGAAHANAIAAGAAGFLTGADKAKLDGVATGATASGATGDAFAAVHLVAFSHSNIANGQTAFTWGNHAAAGYALSASLGSAATHPVGDFASAAQGVKADSASQPGHTQAAATISGLATVATTGAYADLSGKPTLGSAAATASSAYATAAQGVDARTPTAHKATHATGGTDVLSAADIGAATAAQGVLAASASQPGHTQASSTISDSTPAGRALLTGADAAAQRTSLGLGTAATHATTEFANVAGVTGGQSLIGGSGVTDTLVIQGTSGNGTTTAAALIAKVGNNGSVSAVTVLNNGNVGIGTANPVAKFEVNYSGAVGPAIGATNSITVVGPNGTSGQFSAVSFGAPTAGATIAGYSANGIAAAPIVVNKDDVLLRVIAAGYDGTAWSGSRARILIAADENWTTSFQGTRISFFTAVNGSNNLTEKLRISNDGKIGVNAADPAGALDVKGTGTTTGITFQLRDSANTVRVKALDSGVVTIGGATDYAQFSVNGSLSFTGSAGIAASAITSGVIPVARLATGTPNGTKYIRDDGTLAVPGGGLWRGETAPSDPIAYPFWWDTTEIEQGSAALYVSYGTTWVSASPDSRLTDVVMQAGIATTQANIATTAASNIAVVMASGNWEVPPDLAVLFDIQMFDLFGSGGFWTPVVSNASDRQVLFDLQSLQVLGAM